MPASAVCIVCVHNSVLVMMIRVKLKRDRFSARRGGGSKALDVFCNKCNNVVIIYQKDGPGPLLRCYADRIIYPKHYLSEGISYVKEMPKLVCNDCNAVIGIPTRYKEHGEDRLAFNMIKAAFKKKVSKQVRVIN